MFRHRFMLIAIAIALGLPATSPVVAAGLQEQPQAKHKKSSKRKAAKQALSSSNWPPPFQPMAVPDPIEDLPPDLLAISEQIYTGKLPCELGQSVTLLHDGHELGRFNLFAQNQYFHMTPVHSATGAIRLEDPEKGAVWIQLADKSMLMSNQSGERLADVCQSPSQMQVAEAQKMSPPPSLLEPLTGNGLAQK
jgi:hypothetical protein